MIADCSALILAGGDSRRMGQDKAGLRLGERTLLQQVIATVQPLFAEVIISTRQPRSDIELPQVCDDPTHAGPLAGLAAGLERATTPWIFAVACDMPFITARVIEHLAARRTECDAVVPLVRGYPQPLAAFYAKACLPEVLACINGNGRHSLRALLDRLQVSYVGEEQLLAVDPQLRSFFDLDTPQDMATAMNEAGK